MIAGTNLIATLRVGLLFALLLSLAPRTWGQTSNQDRARDFQPSPVPKPEPEIFLGFESDPFNPGFQRQPRPEQSQTLRPSDPDEFTLDIHYEPDGEYVAYTDFLAIIRRKFPRARGDWDGLIGVLRVEAGGSRLQALRNRPFVLVDGKYVAVAKPLKIKAGTVLIPFESVTSMLRHLGFDFGEVEEPSAGDTPTGPSSGADPSRTDAPKRPSSRRPTIETNRRSVTGPRAGPTQGSTRVERQPASSGFFPSDSLLPSVRGRMPPPLAAPLGAVPAAGLSWDQLADRLHRDPVNRLTVVCDPALVDLATRLDRFLTKLEVDIFTVDSQRNSAGLLSEVTRGSPDLLLDLVLAPSAEWLEIWTVHESLWPSGERRGQGAARSMDQFYRLHQDQNLALGSMLHGELQRAMSDQYIGYELSPSYLLRRVDAPSAAILLPEWVAVAESDELDEIGRAIAQGVMDYCTGIESASARE